MIFAIIFMVTALILYSLVIWSEKLKKHLALWMVITFVIAFLSDLTGTTVMRFIATNNTLNTHSACGYVTLIIMLLHLIWAILALLRRGQSEKLFHRFSVYAWGIWLIAFYTGIPK